MRADAKKNYDHILDVARGAFAEDGPEVSMRDISRRADVGLATLLRHFPTRDALYEALLCTNLDTLTKRADELADADPAAEAIVSWIREWVDFARKYKGVVGLMASAHSNPESALYASCAAVHSASGKLLLGAQADGTARTDMSGDDLFALMTALGWAVDQPSFAPRADNLVDLITSAVLNKAS